MEEHGLNIFLRKIYVFKEYYYIWWDLSYMVGFALNGVN